MKSNLDIAETLLRIAREDEETFLLIAGERSKLRRQTFFHAQQAVEKALKAVLTLHGIPVKKTHDLEELYGAIESAGLTCPVPINDLVQLTPYAAMFRYDDTDIPRLDIDVARLVVARTMEWATVEIERRS